MLGESQHEKQIKENCMTYDAECRPGEALKRLSGYVGSSGEVRLRNTIVCCGESTASSGCSLETTGKYVPV